ncbi:hypothetical protein PINS_up023106 [Pythium insidiosum]|nr:hypothetical protein PINS_up023106 [Pythium insidiosum]
MAACAYPVVCDLGRMPALHAQRADDCVECAPGFYSDNNGPDMCKPCVCAPGYASDRAGAVDGTSTCAPCPAGHFSLGNSDQCHKCPVGKYADAGSPHCRALECPPGFEPRPDGGLNVTDCAACPLGMFSSGGTAACASVACPPGQYAHAFARDDEGLRRVPAWHVLAGRQRHGVRAGRVSAWHDLQGRRRERHRLPRVPRRHGGAGASRPPRATTRSPARKARAAARSAPRAPCAPQGQYAKKTEDSDLGASECAPTKCSPGSAAGIGCDVADRAVRRLRVRRVRGRQRRPVSPDELPRWLATAVACRQRHRLRAVPVGWSARAA